MKIYNAAGAIVAYNFSVAWMFSSQYVRDEIIIRELKIMITLHTVYLPTEVKIHPLQPHLQAVLLFLYHRALVKKKKKIELEN